MNDEKWTVWRVCDRYEINEDGDRIRWRHNKKAVKYYKSDGYISYINIEGIQCFINLFKQDEFRWSPSKIKIYDEIQKQYDESKENYLSFLNYYDINILIDNDLIEIIDIEYMKIKWKTNKNIITEGFVSICLIRGILLYINEGYFNVKSLAVHLYKDELNIVNSIVRPTYRFINKIKLNGNNKQSFDGNYVLNFKNFGHEEERSNSNLFYIINEYFDNKFKMKQIHKDVLNDIIYDLFKRKVYPKYSLSSILVEIALFVSPDYFILFKKLEPEFQKIILKEIGKI